jgi:tripartite-type tricarboxylate transporter receptor subunit TctC
MQNFSNRLTWVAVPTVALLGVTACSGSGAEDGTSAAQGLDCRSITQLMPYSAGGGSDQAARRVQEGIEEALGIPTNIEYREGGDGSLAWAALAEAEPDGCTIANVNVPNIQFLSASATEDLGFEADDFRFVAFTEFSPFVFAVGESSEWKTIDEFVEAARARPGELTTGGNGSIGEVYAAEAERALGIDLQYVPVTGGYGEIIPRVAGGHIDSAMAASSAIEGGQLRPLASTDPLPNLDVPTFEDSGYEAVELAIYWGMMLPPGTPDDIVDVWNDAVTQAQEELDAKGVYDELYVQPSIMTADEAQAFADEQLALVQKLLDE